MSHDFETEKNLIEIVRESNASVREALNMQSANLSQLVELQKKSLPISLVFLMFATLLAVIFGKECIEWFFGHSINPVKIGIN